jgi:hypothetical protein
MPTDPRQLALDFSPPLIYIASQLSTLDGEARNEMENWFRAAASAARSAAREGPQSWELDVYCPIEESPPWKRDGRTPEQIYELNFSKITNEADGLIVIGRWGGSFGAGQELAWATGLRLPILYLRREGETLSRQIEGTPADITIETFRSDLEITRRVADFTNSRRNALEAHARYRRGRTLGVMGLFDTFKNKYLSLDQAARTEVSAISHLHPRRLATLTSNPQAIGGATLDELRALAGALNVGLIDALGPEALPELTPEELAALRLAADEWDWSDNRVFSLAKSARFQRAKSGAHRLRLSTPEDWKRFARDMGL